MLEGPRSTPGAAKMKLRRIANTSATQVDLGNVIVLFSYSTPVAAQIIGEGFYRTSQKYSSTTTKQINRWLHGYPAEERPQSFFDNLVNGRTTP
jgi:hypothetical protein